MAMLEPGDTIMGMALDHGGHLTHGMKLNVSGKLYEVVPYHVRREDYLVDMDEVARLAKEHKPKVIVAGWSAYPRQLDFAAFREIADSVGAKLMVDMAHFAGLVAAGEHPNPVEHADVVTTTVHKTLCGPRSGMILCREELAKDINRSIFPGQQGGPLMHIIAAKAVALRIADSEPFRARQRQTIANAQAFAEELIANGVEVLTGGTDVHLVLVDLSPTGLDGKDGRAAARAGRDHRQPQRDPVRRAAADEPVRAADRDAGADHPRPRRGRHARDRAGDRGRALGPLRGRARGAGRADALPDGALSALSPARDRGYGVYCITPAHRPVFWNVAGAAARVAVAQLERVRARVRPAEDDPAAAGRARDAVVVAGPRGVAHRRLGLVNS